MVWSPHPRALLSGCSKGKQFSGLSLKRFRPSIVLSWFVIKGCAQPFQVTEQFPLCPAKQKEKKEVSVLHTNLLFFCKLKKEQLNFQQTQPCSNSKSKALCQKNNFATATNNEQFMSRLEIRLNTSCKATPRPAVVVGQT